MYKLHCLEFELYSFGNIDLHDTIVYIAVSFKFPNIHAWKKTFLLNFNDFLKQILCKYVKLSLRY